MGSSSKTSGNSWIKKISRYKEQTIHIFGLSKSIRYVSVINDYGKTLTGTMRPGLGPLLNRENALNEFFILSTAVSLRRESIKQLGGLDHYILYHKKVIQVLIPVGDNIVYVSLGPRTRNIDELITKIKKVIRSH